MSDLRTEIMRATAIRYAWTFIGRPYRWGGDDPMAGFDCSGFVVEILKSVGILPPNADTTADGLARMFAHAKTDKPRAGCIVVWDKAGQGIHTELMIDDYHTIGASGGGSATTTLDAAIVSNAFIKIRPVGYRGMNYRAFDPFGGSI